MMDQELQRKLEQVDIMESQIYGHRTMVPSDYRDMLKFAEAMYQTSGEILEHIKNEAKKRNLMIKIKIGDRAHAKEWRDAYQPGFLKTYGWHFYQFYGRASQASSYASEVNTKNGIVPVNDTEMITYVGGGIWDVR